MKKHIIFVTNMPTPYRTPVFDALSSDERFQITVIYCSKIESNRSWEVNSGQFNEVYLKSNFKKKSDGFNFVHNNTDVFGVLKGLKPRCYSYLWF